MSEQAVSRRSETTALYMWQRQRCTDVQIVHRSCPVHLAVSTERVSQVLCRSAENGTFYQWMELLRQVHHDAEYVLLRPTASRSPHLSSLSRMRHTVLSLSLLRAVLCLSAISHQSGQSSLVARLCRARAALHSADHVLLPACRSHNRATQQAMVEARTVSERFAWPTHV